MVLLTGHPNSLTVSPVEEIEVENGNPVTFIVQVLDEAGNITASDNKPLILLCKVCPYLSVMYDFCVRL